MASIGWRAGLKARPPPTPPDVRFRIRRFGRLFDNQIMPAGTTTYHSRPYTSAGFPRFSTGVIPVLPGGLTRGSSDPVGGDLSARSEGASCIPAGASASMATSKDEGHRINLPFGPSVGLSSDLLCPWLTSRCSSALAVSKETSPGNAHPPSRVYPPHLRPRLPDRDRASEIIASLPTVGASVWGSCSSDPRFAFGFLQIGPRDPLLAVRLTVPPVRSAVDFHHQVSAPCRAHNKKAAPLSESRF